MSGFRSTVSRFAERAADNPSAPAIVQGKRVLTYGSLRQHVGSVAGTLRRGGLRDGDRVAILLDNSAEYVAAYYGALAAGGVSVGLSSAARLRELSAWLEHCGATWLIADTRHPDFRGLADGERRWNVIAVGGASDDGLPWHDVVAAEPLDLVAVTPETPASIIYTSGTTGRPKGVTLTHGNLAANTESIVEYLGLTAADRVLSVLPFFYSYGNSVLHTHLTVGATLILENSLAFPQRVLERIAAEQATGFPGVPSTFALLLQSDLGRFDLSSLRYVTQAGGAMPVANIERLRRALPNADLFVMYGQTEATARLTYLPPARLADKLGSVGIAVPGTQIRVCREDGSTAEVGEAGEVCARGPHVMHGYYRDPEATAAVIKGGWLHTGDLGQMDADGYLSLQGRRSDMIKSGAHRISPLDIEEVIAVLPEVAEVAVVGIPDALLGEAVKAVIILRPGAVLDVMTVQRHCSGQLPRYKVPRLVEFSDRLPRTSSGKVMRYLLAQPAPGLGAEVRLP